MNGTSRLATNTQIIVAAFDGTETADRAMSALERVAQSGWVKTADAAVLVRSADGFVTARDAKEIDVLRDTLAGAISGGLAGLLAGPIGFAAGSVAGGLVAGTASDLSRYCLTREDITAVVTQLPAGSSALVAAVEPAVANKLMAELQKLKAKMVRRIVRDAVANGLGAAPGHVRTDLQGQI